MMDFLFSVYFFFFMKREEKGARASISLLIFPPTFFVYSLFLFLLSFAIYISDLGAFEVVAEIILCAISVNFLFEKNIS